MTDARCYPPRSDAPGRLRLVCVPFAGGGAGIYGRWAAAMPDGVEVWPVQLPGRERRLRETPYRRMAPLVDELWSDTAARLDGPWAVFGHSMGAAIAYELARRGVAEGHAPEHLFVSARRAPGVPPRHPPLFAMPKERMLAETERLYGAFPPALKAHPALLEAMIPTMRADFELLDTWHAPQDRVLDCPITGYAGVGDPAHPPHDLAGWADVTTGPFELVAFEGGHFDYVRARHDARDHVAAVISGWLDDAAPGDSSPPRPRHG